MNQRQPTQTARRAAVPLLLTAAALASRGGVPAELARQTPKEEPAMGSGGSGTGQSRKAEHPVLEVINRGGEGRLKEWLGEGGYLNAIEVLSEVAVYKIEKHRNNPLNVKLQLNMPTGYIQFGEFMGGTGTVSMNIWIVNCLPDGTRTGMMGFGEICMTTTGDVYFRYYQPNYSVQSATGEYVSIPLPVIR